MKLRCPDVWRKKLAPCRSIDHTLLPLVCKSLPGKVETESLYARQRWHKGLANLFRGAYLPVEVLANDTQAEIRGSVAQLLYCD